MTQIQARFIFIAVVVSSTLYYIAFHNRPFAQDD